MNDKELLELVNEIIRVYRKYYRTSDTDILPKAYSLLNILKDVNKKLHFVMDDTTIFYLYYPYQLTYSQIYDIIKVVTDIDFQAINEEVE